MVLIPYDAPWSPVGPLPFAGAPGWEAAYAGQTLTPSGSSYTAGAPAPVKNFPPLSDAFKGKLDKPLPLAKYYDKLALELGKRGPQLLALIAPYKGMPGVTFTVTSVQMATASAGGGGPTMGATLRLSAGGPQPEAPVTGNSLGFTFASLGISIVIDRVLADQGVAPYKRGAFMVGTYALASRLATGSWAGGKTAFKGWAQFNFFSNLTYSALEILGIKDPTVLAYGSAGITAATMLAHHLMNPAKTVALKTIQSAAGTRGVTAVAPKLVGKVLWVLQVVDIGGGIAEDIVYDPYTDRGAIYLGFEREEMRDRAPTGLKWTTNFSFVRWPMRWFGGSDDAAEEKTRKFIATEVAPQLNAVADAAEAQLLISAAKAVGYAQLMMVDPCLPELAWKSVDSTSPLKTRCTTFLSEELTEARKAGMARVGIIPQAEQPFEMPTAWVEPSWGNSDPWGQDDEHLRYQFWEYLARGTHIYFHPDLQIGEYRTFQNAFGLNDLVSGVDEAAPWHAMTNFINEKGRITDHRQFGAYLKDPVKRHCDRVGDDMGDNLLALAKTCFSPDGKSFDTDKFRQLVASYYQTPGFKEGIEEFYDLLVIDSVHGGESRGQEIAKAFNVRGEMQDQDAVVLFLIKKLRENAQQDEEKLRSMVKLSGLDPDALMTHNAATGALEFHTELLTPEIEGSIREKIQTIQENEDPDFMADFLLYADRWDALYYNLNSPFSEDYIDSQTTPAPPEPDPKEIFQASPVGSLDMTDTNTTFL